MPLKHKMEEKIKNFDELVSKAETYGKTSVELIKLKTVDKVADGTSSFVAWSAVIIALVLFFITLNFGLALWIGALLDKIYLGFFVVAGFYGLAGIILFIFRNKWIKKPLNDSMINQMLN
jgi:hypothetical protein